MSSRCEPFLLPIDQMRRETVSDSGPSRVPGPGGGPPAEGVIAEPATPSIRQPLAHDDGRFDGVAIVPFAAACLQKPVPFVESDSRLVGFANLQIHAVYTAGLELLDRRLQKRTARAFPPASRHYGEI